VSDPFDVDPLAESEGIVYVGEDGVPEEGASDSAPSSEGPKPEEPPARRGPKQVPGPNDDLPPLTTAADLLGDDDPLSSLPQEPPDDDTPPDSAAPAFIVVKGAYGPGVDSVKLASGQPVGQWLHEDHPALDGGQVSELLIHMGMDGDRAAWFGIQRDKARAARGELARNQTVLAFANEEERRKAEKQQIQDAFVKAQKAKK